MTPKSLGNPFDGDQSLIHAKHCGCHECAGGAVTQPLIETRGTATETGPESSEAMLDRAIESAVVRSVFGHDDHTRRSFMKLVGSGTAAAMIGSFFPCLLYTSPSPRDRQKSRMPSSA